MLLQYRKTTIGGKVGSRKAKTRAGSKTTFPPFFWDSSIYVSCQMFCRMCVIDSKDRNLAEGIGFIQEESDRRRIDRKKCCDKMQGCQTAYFQTKNPNLDKFRSVFQLNESVIWPFGLFLLLFGTFYCHLVYVCVVYFMVIWYILRSIWYIFPVLECCTKKICQPWYIYQHMYIYMYCVLCNKQLK
jgi:hypothetical protein